MTEKKKKNLWRYSPSNDYCSRREPVSRHKDLPEERRISDIRIRDVSTCPETSLGVPGVPEWRE